MDFGPNLHKCIACEQSETEEVNGLQYAARELVAHEELIGHVDVARARERRGRLEEGQHHDDKDIGVQDTKQNKEYN